MTSPTLSTWKTKLLATMRAAPRKFAVMIGLGLILLAMILRLIFGSSGPSSAFAAVPGAPSGALASALDRSGDPFASRPASARDWAILQWTRLPILPLTRNLFAVPLDFYRRDGDHGGDLSVGAGFWDRLAKSLSAHADQQEQRQILIDNVRIMAGSLKLESIVMGAQPSAMVNGNVVQQGSDIAGFRVLRIEPRMLILERQGVRLAIVMD
jgi:hypothetical protein